MAGGRFAIESTLGQGGMGVVYLARDRERGGERVALKRLNADVDPAGLRAEFDAARRLRHPVIVAVRDFGRDEDGFFLTMEYVEGEDLAALAGKLDPGRVAGFALQIGDALEYARRRGFVHGDLKPQNLRVPRADPTAVRILDLGLARLVGRPVTGGTPAYLAPEVLAGKPADTRADLFALGCVLHEALSGRPAFTGIDRSTPPAPLPESVPADLRDVIARLLKRRPEDRPGRAADLVVLLGRVAPLKLPLPEGDLVGRDAVIARVAPGRILVLEAEEGMGATRLLGEIAERGEAAGSLVVTRDVGESAAGVAPDATLVVACRPGAAAAATAGAERVRLEPLGEADVLALVDSRLPLEPGTARAVASWAWRESRGTPALVVEALERLRDSDLLRPGPLGLEVDADALARFVPPVPERIARAIARLDPAARHRLARSAVAGGEPMAEGLRRALVATLADAERLALHAAAAEALLGRADSDPRAVARHLLGAGREREAAPWLVRAGEAARAAGDRRDARRCFAFAVELLEPGGARARARLDLAKELALAGDHDAALESGRLAREEDPALEVESFLAEAELHAGRLESGAARRAAVEVIRRTRGEGGETDRARALFVLGRIATMGAHYETARRHFETALVVHRALGPPVAVARVANALGNVESMAKRHDAALRWYELALAAARDGGDRRIASVVLQNLGRIYAMHRRDGDRAREVIAEAVAEAEREGDTGRLGRALFYTALIEFDHVGEDAAIRSLDRAIDLQERTGEAGAAAYSRLLLAEFLGVLGRFEAGRQHALAVLQQARDSQDPRLEAAALDEAGRNALDQEKWQDARHYLEQALPAALGPEAAARRASIRASLAIALIGEGRIPDAAKCLAEDESGAVDEPDVAARWTRADALVRYRLGEPQAALDVLRGQVQRLGSAGFELERARSLLLLGRLLVESRQRDDALAVLEEARTLFDRRKAKALLARTLLAKARARIARTPYRGDVIAAVILQPSGSLTEGDSSRRARRRRYQPVPETGRAASTRYSGGVLALLATAPAPPRVQRPPVAGRATARCVTPTLA